jgi:tetratricopeptide (TPR) repeat protein
LEHADQALGIARGLAEDAAHDWLLGRCLHNRAVVLSRLGRTAKAAKAARKAVRVRRRLVQAEPAIHDLELTDSLALSLALLYTLDLDEQAIEYGNEAAAILRRGTEDPVRCKGLADVMHKVALASSAIRRYREAIDAMSESITLRRTLDGEPEADRQTSLARALRQRSSDLNAIGRHDEARSDIEEAAQIFRRLADVDPDRFQPEVARCESQATRQRAKESHHNAADHAT